MNLRTVFALLALTLGASAPAAPAQAQAKPIDPSDPFALYALSEQYRSKLESNSRRSEDEETVKRVLTLGRKLARVCDNPLMTVQFAVLDSTVPNAVSLPRGHIFVNQGLAGRVQDDGHLAFVLGHELAHICLRHSAGLLKAHFLLKGLGRDEVELKQRLGGFRRDEELEADRYGLLYAVRAGFKLDRALGFFDLGLSSEPAAMGGESTHPSLAERKTNLAAFGDKLLKAHGLFEEAGQAYRSSQYDRAIARLTEFLEYFPNSTAALTNLGTACLRRAVKFLDSLPQGLSDELIFIPVVDVVVRAEAEPVYVQRALEAYEKAAALDPRWVAADINSVAIHIREGRSDDARRLLDRASRFASADPRTEAVLEVHLGNLDVLKSDLAAAEVHYEKARKLDPGVGAAAYDLAIVREKQGKKAEAVALLTELAKSPDWSSRAATRLGTLGAPLPPAPAGAVKAEDALAGLHLGDSPEEVRAAFGDPGKNNILRSQDGQEWSYEGGSIRLLISVDPKTGKAVWVDSVTISGGEHKTARGIGVGDPLTRLKEKYGPADRIDALHGQWSYAGSTLLFRIEGDRITEITISMVR